MTPEQEIRAAALSAAANVLQDLMLKWDPENPFTVDVVDRRVQDIHKDGFYVINLFEEYIRHGLKERE